MTENMATALKHLTGRRSIRAIADDVAIPQATLNRQASSNAVPVGDLLTICRHYGLSILDVLHESGMITRDEARQMGGAEGLDAYTELELAEEVYNRELSKVVAQAKRGNVAKLSVVPDTDRQHEGARAAKRHTEDVPEDTP